MAQKFIVGDVVKYNNKIMVVKEPRDGIYFGLSCPKEGLVYNLVDIEDIKPVRLLQRFWRRIDGCFITLE